MGAINQSSIHTTQILLWLLVSVELLEVLPLDPKISLVLETFHAAISCEKEHNVSAVHAGWSTYYSGLILNSQLHLVFSKLFWNNWYMLSNEFVIPATVPSFGLPLVSVMASRRRGAASPSNPL